MSMHDFKHLSKNAYLPAREAPVSLADHMRVGLGAYLIMAVIMIFLLVSWMDHIDEQREQANYCENVAKGYWPDFNGNAAEVCK